MLNNENTEIQMIHIIDYGEVAGRSVVRLRRPVETRMGVRSRFPMVLTENADPKYFPGYTLIAELYLHYEADQPRRKIYLRKITTPTDAVMREALDTDQWVPVRSLGKLAFGTSSCVRDIVLTAMRRARIHKKLQEKDL